MRQELEQRAIGDYQAVHGNIILVRYLTAYLGDTVLRCDGRRAGARLLGYYPRP